MPNPTTAAEWAAEIIWRLTGMPPDNTEANRNFLDTCTNVLDAFARQQVEIERSKWISDQCTANQAGQAMGRIEGYMEGWNAALKAFREEIRWLDEFFVEPEWFSNTGDRQYWRERRAAIRHLKP